MRATGARQAASLRITMEYKMYSASEMLLANIALEKALRITGQTLGNVQLVDWTIGDLALAMSGEPFHMTMPAIFGIRLVGKLPDWVSAKDVILEMLRRHGVAGGVGRILEYFGPGLDSLSAMDRHVIANMGAELGATTLLQSCFEIKSSPTHK
jgi:Aconitase family (aconitate hydratase)